MQMPNLFVILVVTVMFMVFSSNFGETAEVAKLPKLAMGAKCTPIANLCDDSCKATGEPCNNHFECCSGKTKTDNSGTKICCTPMGGCKKNEDCCWNGICIFDSCHPPHPGR